MFPRSHIPMDCQIHCDLIFFHSSSLSQEATTTTTEIFSVWRDLIQIAFFIVFDSKSRYVWICPQSGPVYVVVIYICSDQNGQRKWKERQNTAKLPFINWNSTWYWFFSLRIIRKHREANARILSHRAKSRTDYKIQSNGQYMMWYVQSHR